MDAITELFEQNISSLILGIFIVMSGIIAMVTIIGKFSEIIGKPVKWVKNKNADHELLIKTVNNLTALQERHEKDVTDSNLHDEEMRKDIKNLTAMFIDKEINDMRWEINNFATKVSERKPCNKDSYKHCIHTYEKYEKLLEENGLENGEVEISMEIVNEAYKQKLKEGF